jgi:hypothetical protein
MSGAAGAIAALALGPRYRRQAALKNKFLPPGQSGKPHMMLPGTPALILKTQKSDTSCAHNFFSAGKQPGWSPLQTSNQTSTDAIRQPIR